MERTSTQIDDQLVALAVIEAEANSTASKERLNRYVVTISGEKGDHVECVPQSP